MATRSGIDNRLGGMCPDGRFADYHTPDHIQTGGLALGFDHAEIWNFVDSR